MWVSTPPFVKHHSWQNQKRLFHILYVYPRDCYCYIQRIGWRENPEETIDFPIHSGAFRLKCSLKNQSIDINLWFHLKYWNNLEYMKIPVFPWIKKPIIDLLGPKKSPQLHGRHGPLRQGIQGARLHRDEPGSSTRQTSFFRHLLGDVFFWAVLQNQTWGYIIRYDAISLDIYIYSIHM